MPDALSMRSIPETARPKRDPTRPATSFGIEPAAAASRTLASGSNAGARAGARVKTLGRLPPGAAPF